MNNGAFVTDWVLKTIKEKYAEDIAIVVAHNTLRIDESQEAMSYFVPITDKGRQFAQTFILEGEGFDIWGIEWNRLEQFAELNEYNITCLADGEVIYAKNPAERDRFESLKKLQAENLKNHVLQRAHALEAFSQAKQIYLEMLFAQRSDIKLGAAYVLDYLSRSICFSHGGYFKKAQTEQLAELLAMGEVPTGFPELYNAILYQKDGATQKKQCYELIGIVDKFLEKSVSAVQKERNFQDLSDWYAELSYTWLRIRYYCKESNITKVFMWGAMLQEELNHVCEDFGIAKMELMSEFDPQKLSDFAKHSNSIEVKIRQAIIDGGGKIREYKSREEFLNEI